MRRNLPALVVSAVIFLLLALMSVGLWNCASCRQLRSHIVSGVVGIERTVTLYAADGRILRSWDGRFNVEDAGASIRFITTDGRTVTVSGTYVVEERPAPPAEK